MYDTERLIERPSVSVVHGGSALRAAKRTSNSTPKYALELIFTALSPVFLRPWGRANLIAKTKLVALHALVKIVLETLLSASANQETEE